MKVGGIELIDQIPEVDEVAESPVENKVDYSASLEELKYREKLNAVEQLEHQLREQRTMLTVRQAFAGLLFLGCVGWMFFIGSFVKHFGEVTVMPVFEGLVQVRPVSDTVMIALITTTTINVLGLLYIVARWLFPIKEDKAVKEKTASLRKAATEAE